MQGSDTLVVAPGTRGTILPRGLGERAAAWVHSTAPVVVERPTYFAGYTAGNAQRVWGAATVVGAPAPSGDLALRRGLRRQRVPGEPGAGQFRERVGQRDGGAGV